MHTGHGIWRNVMSPVMLDHKCVNLNGYTNESGIFLEEWLRLWPVYKLKSIFWSDSQDLKGQLIIMYTGKYIN
mgnify:CR=1 FL=1